MATLWPSKSSEPARVGPPNQGLPHPPPLRNIGTQTAQLNDSRPNGLASLASRNSVHASTPVRRLRNGVDPRGCSADLGDGEAGAILTRTLQESPYTATYAVVWGRAMRALCSGGQAATPDRDCTSGQRMPGGSITVACGRRATNPAETDHAHGVVPADSLTCSHPTCVYQHGESSPRAGRR